MPIRNAFFVGFEKAGTNAHARRWRHLGLEHHEIVVHPRRLNVLPDSYGITASRSAMRGGTHLLLSRLRGSVSVFYGDGGDESFGSYWRVQSGIYAAGYGALAPKP